MEYKVNLGDESIAAIADMIKEQKVKVESKSITENGTYTAPSGKAYSPVTVNVPNPSTGTLQITENGEGIDVRQYAAVDVNVSGGDLFELTTVVLQRVLGDTVTVELEAAGGNPYTEGRYDITDMNQTFINLVDDGATIFGSIENEYPNPDNIEAALISTGNPPVSGTRVVMKYDYPGDDDKIHLYVISFDNEQSVTITYPDCVFYIANENVSNIFGEII